MFLELQYIENQYCVTNLDTHSWFNASMNVSFNLSICKAATAQPLTATLTSQVPIGSPKSSMAAFDKEVDLLELFGSFIVVRFALNPRSLGTIESRTSIRELLPLFSIGDTLPPKELNLGSQIRLCIPSFFILLHHLHLYLLIYQSKWKHRNACTFLCLLVVKNIAITRQPLLTILNRVDV